LAAHDISRVRSVTQFKARAASPTRALDEIISLRAKFLTDYQDQAYADRYLAAVDKVRKAETAASPSSSELSEAVTKNLFKLMAYKDEYEVARLFSDGRFEKQLREQFEGDFKFSFNFAAPFLARGVDALGRPGKRVFGSWMMTAFRILAKMRGLRGTAFDIFGQTDDRKLERDLIAGYERDVATVLSLLSPATHDTAVEILSLPDRIRGYGPVKVKAVQDAKARYAQLAADLVNPPPVPRQIAAE
jgi:indolepyruvate ferredoxin oxidoreductase